MRVVHDERAAAFYALGHARARSGSCACVVTTSGTAVANLLPAACEADRDSIPIVFATADRPAEMRGVGADQVLEQQQDLLRSTVRRVADLPPADDRVAALGDLGEVSSIAAAALREEDPVRTRSGKRISVVASMA
jgi:2-succinyl-5-enolpyruvyl-6-hydroxy-3-cyclohexene-1-carboxylate synthase